MVVHTSLIEYIFFFLEEYIFVITYKHIIHILANFQHFFISRPKIPQDKENGVENISFFN